MDSSYLTLSLSNAFLSYTSTMLNIVTIHAIRKTPSLSKNLKALLLSQAVSDLGVGLLAQPMYAARLIMESKLNSGTNSSYNVIYIAYLIPTNLFTIATLFLIVVLCAERFASVHFYLSYHELLTHKRVVAVVVSIWFLSGVLSSMRLWIPKNITYMVYGITGSACIIAAIFFSVRIYLSVRHHVNQIQVLQLQQVSQNGEMANIKRMRKFAIMAVYVCLVLLVCYLPNGFTLFVTALSGSNTGINHVQHYTLTLELLHSSLNPLIYCWKMKHVRHTVIGILRNALKLSKHH